MISHVYSSRSRHTLGWFHNFTFWRTYIAFAVMSTMAMVSTSMQWLLRTFITIIE